MESLEKIRDTEKEKSGESGALDQYSEQREKQKEREAIIEKGVARAREIISCLKDVPERIRPALRLHVFNNFIISENVRGESGGPAQQLEVERKFKDVIEEERSAENNYYLPTIGVEIEVPTKFEETIYAPLYQATEQLGIPRTADEAWEFSTQFSYSARAQSLLVHELIRGGFIETVGEKGEKKIRGEGDFSLHVNFGMMPELVSDIRGNHQEENYEKLADILTNALTYAFTSPERFRKRKTVQRFLKRGLAESAVKKKKQEVSKGTKEIWTGWERLEIRSLEVRDKTLYRMLLEAQYLAAALFAKHKLDKDEKEEKLSNEWSDFENKTASLLEKYKLRTVDIDRGFGFAAETLENTPIRREMRELITAASIKIGKFLEEKTPTP